MAGKATKEDGITAEDYYIKIHDGKVFLRLTQNAYRKIKSWGKVVNCEYHPDHFTITPEDGVHRTTPVKKSGYYWLIFSVVGDLPTNWKDGLYLGGFTEERFVIVLPIEETTMSIHITKGRGPHSVFMTKEHFEALGKPYGVLVTVVEDRIVLTGSQNGYKLNEKDGNYHAAVTHKAVKLPGPDFYSATEFKLVTIEKDHTITIKVPKDQEYEAARKHTPRRVKPHGRVDGARKPKTQLPADGEPGQLFVGQTEEEKAKILNDINDHGQTLDQRITEALNLLNNLPEGYLKEKSGDVFQVYTMRPLYNA